VVAKLAVVRDVDIAKQVVVRPDARNPAFVGRAVNGHSFADCVVIANLDTRDATLPFQVLRPQSDAGERKDIISLSQPRVTVNDHVGMQFAPLAQYHVLSNDAIRPDLAVRAELRLGCMIAVAWIRLILPTGSAP